MTFDAGDFITCVDAGGYPELKGRVFKAERLALDRSIVVIVLGGRERFFQYNRFIRFNASRIQRITYHV